MSQISGGRQEDKRPSYQQIVDSVGSKQEQKYEDESHTHLLDDSIKLGIVEYLDEQTVISLSRTGHYWHEFIPLNQSFIESRAASRIAYAEFKALCEPHAMEFTWEFLKFCDQRSQKAAVESSRVFNYIANRCLEWMSLDSSESEDINAIPIKLQEQCESMERALKPFLKSPNFVLDAFYGRFPKHHIKGYLLRLVNQAQQIVQQTDWRKTLENPDTVKIKQLEQWASFLRDMQLLEGILVAVSLLTQLADQLEEYRRSSGLPDGYNFKAPSVGALIQHADGVGAVVVRAFTWFENRAFLFNNKAHPRILLVLDDLWCLGKSPIENLLRKDKALQGERNYLSRFQANDLLPFFRAGKGNFLERNRHWYKKTCYSQVWTRLSKEDHTTLTSGYFMPPLAELKLDPLNPPCKLLDQLPPERLGKFLLDCFQDIETLSDISPWLQVRDKNSSFANMDGTCGAVNLTVLVVISKFFDRNPLGLTKNDLESLLKKAVPQFFNIYFLPEEERNPEKMRFLFGQALSMAQLAELITRYYILMHIFQRLERSEAQSCEMAIKLLYFECVIRKECPIGGYTCTGLNWHYQCFFELTHSSVPLNHYSEALTQGREIKPLRFGPLSLRLPPKNKSFKDQFFLILERVFSLLLCSAVCFAMPLLLGVLISYLFPAHMGLTVFLMVSSGIAELFSCIALMAMFTIFSSGPSLIDPPQPAWQSKLVDNITLFLILMSLAMMIALAVMTMNFWDVVAVAVPGGSTYFFGPYFLTGAIASFVLIFIIGYIHQCLTEKYFSYSLDPEFGVRVLHTLSADELWAPRASQILVPAVQPGLQSESEQTLELVTYIKG